jgi:hypothetical protein
MPYEHKEIVMDSITMDQFIGTYKEKNEFRIERRGAKLFRVLSDGNALELKPESATKFFYSDGSDRQLEFELDANKKIAKTWLIAFGTKIEFKKIQ